MHSHDKVRELGISAHKRDSKTYTLLMQVLVCAIYVIPTRFWPVNFAGADKREFYVH